MDLWGNLTISIFLDGFEECHFIRLVEGLKIPEYYVCPQRTACHGTEALLILLRRLTYPNRLCELQHMFGRPEPELSMILNTVVLFGTLLLIAMLIS